MNRTVGIIGLGKMGLPIAVNLLEHGFIVMGYRRHMQDDFIMQGGIPASSSKELARQGDVIITCLPRDDALRDAIMGPEGVVHGAHAGLIVIDTGMHMFETKEQTRHALEQVGAHMLDCPISGIPPQVVARKAIVFGSGDKQVFETCLPVLQGITSNVFYLGQFGAGIKMKCIANLLVAIHVLATAEAMALSSKVGLDAESVIQVLSPSIAGSAQFTARAPMMSAKRYEPPLSTIHQMEECIIIIKALADASGSQTPLLSTAAQYYERAIADGLGEKDVAAMFSVLSEEARGQGDGQA